MCSPVPGPTEREDARFRSSGRTSLLLRGAHILQRPERTFNHMAETHAQNEENKRGWGGGAEARQRQRKGGTGTESGEKVGE